MARLLSVTAVAVCALTYGCSERILTGPPAAGAGRPYIAGVSETYPEEEGWAYTLGGEEGCPVRYNGTLWTYINVRNVGQIKFWFTGFTRTRVTAPTYALYRPDAPGEGDYTDYRGRTTRWYAEGTVEINCPFSVFGWHPVKITGFNGTVWPAHVAEAPTCEDWQATDYDPYSGDNGGGGEPGASGGTCTEGTDGSYGGGGSGAGSCDYEYAYIDISYDGGITWIVWWEGWVLVCG